MNVELEAVKNRILEFANKDKPDSSRNAQMPKNQTSTNRTLRSLSREEWNVAEFRQEILDRLAKGQLKSALKIAERVFDRRNREFKQVMRTAQDLGQSFTMSSVSRENFPFADALMLAKCRILNNDLEGAQQPLFFCSQVLMQLLGSHETKVALSQIVELAKTPEPGSSPEQETISHPLLASALDKQQLSRIEEGEEEKEESMEDSLPDAPLEMRVRKFKQRRGSSVEVIVSEGEQDDIQEAGTERISFNEKERRKRDLVSLLFTNSAAVASMYFFAGNENESEEMHAMYL